MISFTVYGEARPGGSKTVARHGSKTWIRESTKGWRDWKLNVAQAAGEAMNGRELLRGPLSVAFVFYRPRPKAHLSGKGAVKPSAPAYPTTRPDALKLARAVEDALSGVVYADDAQIVTEWLAKRYGEPARVSVEIMEIHQR